MLCSLTKSVTSVIQSQIDASTRLKKTQMIPRFRGGLGHIHVELQTCNCMPLPTTKTIVYVHVGSEL